MRGPKMRSLVLRPVDCDVIDARRRRGLAWWLICAPIWKSDDPADGAWGSGPNGSAVEGWGGWIILSKQFEPEETLLRMDAIFRRKLGRKPSAIKIVRRGGGGGGGGGVSPYDLRIVC